MATRANPAIHLGVGRLAYPRHVYYLANRQLDALIRSDAVLRTLSHLKMSATTQCFAVRGRLSHLLSRAKRQKEFVVLVPGILDAKMLANDIST